MNLLRRFHLGPWGLVCFLGLITWSAAALCAGHRWSILASEYVLTIAIAAAAVVAHAGNPWARTFAVGFGFTAMLHWLLARKSVLGNTLARAIWQNWLMPEGHLFSDIRPDLQGQVWFSIVAGFIGGWWALVSANPKSAPRTRKWEQSGNWAVLHRGFKFTFLGLLSLVLLIGLSLGAIKLAPKTTGFLVWPEAPGCYVFIAIAAGATCAVHSEPRGTLPCSSDSRVSRLSIGY